jgi:ribosomal protein S18 acetylase RimI-like enzyme
MRRFSESKKARVVIAEEGEVLAGFGILHVERGEHGPAGYIVTLDVDPGYRGRGLARRLMAAMQGLAEAAGCTAMVLHVFTGNDAAIRFYERNGFSRSYLVRAFYGPDLDAWVCHRWLGSSARPETE